MTGFAIGLSAAALWVVVLVGVLLLARSSSGPPQRSIQRFKSDRQAIKTARAAAISDTTASDPAPDAARSGPQIEVEAAQLVQLNWDGLLITQNVDASEEVQEIEALVGSVTDSRAHTQPARATARRPRAPATGGLKKKGRITYVLVDDEGRPQI